MIVTLYGTQLNAKEVEKQVQQNLADVAKQNAALLKTKIDTEYELLNSLSRELNGVTPETITEKLDSFKIFIGNFNLKRFAYCFPGGMAYSTDGAATDLNWREFYHAGMRGQCYITDVLDDAIQSDHAPINIITIPVYNDSQKVTGVFGLTYDTEQFNDYLQIESFDGSAYSCIINENFEIMASTNKDSLQLSHNIIEDALKANPANKAAIESITEQVENKTEGKGVFYLSGKNYYYSVPVDLMDGSITWHIFTIIPADILMQKVTPIQHNQYTIVICVIALTVIGSLLIILFMKEQHQRMINLAYEDPVTGGDNYTKFYAEMEIQYRQNGYLIAMDIANLNYLTIASGENKSNQMIREAWNIIRDSLSKNEMAAHIQDETFVLFLTNCDADTLLERMETISKKINSKAKSFHVYGIRAEYGIYQMTETEPLENAYSKARIAKEYATQNPESDYSFYREVNGAKLQREKQLEELFPTAIQNEEFEIWYQPKYDAANYVVVGSEALVRWRKEDGQMISPGEFIPLFEQNGMIAKLDEYVFRMVCRQQKQWLEEGKTLYPVSVNISKASLYYMDVEKRYIDIMKEYNINPQYIQLEITETAMEARKDICELLNRFRQLGVKILMDDFGTGYSSLATLSTQCFDTLKLDKSLIDHIGNKDGETILYHTIRMGQQMGLHITAEGVELKHQLEFLQNLKCDDIQGFYFARPMPVHEYDALVNAV